MGTSTAIKAFNENLELFGNPRTSPHEFNLNTGLLNLARAVRTIEQKLDELDRKVESIRTRVNALG